MSWATIDAGGAGVPYVEQVRADAAAIARSLREQGLDAVVGHCPGWVVGDVVQHLGEVHRWAAEIVRTGRVAMLEEGSAVDGVAALAEWFEEGAAILCRTLEAVDPERACWTFGFPPERTGFWRRRQALETAVHRFDVAAAAASPFDLSVDVAARGVTEVVDFMFPRQVALQRTPPLATPVALRAVDTGEAWVLGDGGDPHAEITGTAPALLLMLWRRPHADVERTGDPEALAAFDAAALVP